MAAKQQIHPAKIHLAHPRQMDFSILITDTQS